jgi:hypothetical protein
MPSNINESHASNTILLKYGDFGIPYNLRDMDEKSIGQLRFEFETLCEHMRSLQDDSVNMLGKSVVIHYCTYQLIVQKY